MKNTNGARPLIGSGVQMQTHKKQKATPGSADVSLKHQLGQFRGTQAPESNFSFIPAWLDLFQRPAGFL